MAFPLTMSALRWRKDVVSERKLLGIQLVLKCCHPDHAFKYSVQ